MQLMQSKTFHQIETNKAQIREKMAKKYKPVEEQDSGVRKRKGEKEADSRKNKEIISLPCEKE